MDGAGSQWMAFSLFREEAVKKNAEHNQGYQHIHPVMFEGEGNSRKQYAGYGRRNQQQQAELNNCARLAAPRSLRNTGKSSELGWLTAKDIVGVAGMIGSRQQQARANEHDRCR